MKSAVMGRMIEIKKNTEGILDVDLIDILNVIEPEGATLVWTLFDLEATGDLGDGNNILDLEQEVRESPGGLSLNWNDLVSLARRLSQVINAILAASRGSVPAAAVNDLYAHSEIAIEAIDSSLWRLYSRSDALIERLKKCFDAEEVQTR
jgi:hypothetical protein